MPPAAVRRRALAIRAACGATRAAALALAGLLLLASAAGAAADPLQPPGTGGIAAVDRALLRLGEHRRLLVVGAHPDDEDTTLLALVSLGQGGEAAYLSLTRGEGGQNLIGEELGEGLGVLRTEELLAARRVDRARQFFTRAYDFGYTRSLAETLRLWPREELLEDAVRVIRRFRPQVVVSVFPADERGGHGQHQAAGVIAEEAFAAAGDPQALPQLAAEGLLPWQPQRFYREAWWDPETATLTLEAGHIDPLTGRSFAQLAMESRSQHRSQSMGRLQEPGPRPVRLTLVELGGAGGGAADGGAAAAGEGEEEGALFAGIGTELAAIAALLAESAEREALAERLEGVAARAAAARAALAPARLAEAAPALAAILAELRLARQGLAGSQATGASHADALVAEKEAIAAEALAAAAGVVLDATSEQAAVVPGDVLPVTVRLWNAGPYTLRPAPAPLTLRSPAGWGESLTLPLHDAAAAPGAAAPGEVAPGALVERQVEVAVDPAAEPTVPYYLRRPRRGAMYDLDAVPAELRGLPDDPPPLVAALALELLLPGAAGDAAVPLTLERPVVQRVSDLAVGEVRRPLRAVPRLEVAVTPGLLLWPLPAEGARVLAVELTAHGDAPIVGELRVEPPPGWPRPRPLPFTLDPQRRRATVEVALAAPEGLATGRYPVEVVAVTSDGAGYDLALPLVDYPHVRPRPLPRPAQVQVSAFPLELPDLERVGYVRGAADEVPEALAAVGVPVELLRVADLPAVDLSAYDAVVLGSRVHDAFPELGAAHSALLDYVRGGGLLLVQFQRWEYFQQGLPPLPMTMERRGAGRTTDETVPVLVLEPDHPVFRHPNPIGAADWQGWVQERGLYYPQSWDPAYSPLLAMADPGEDAERGALLVAPVGEGTYVYTGLAFFRQLPAGVPGAFRLFANLLALAEGGS